MIMVIMVLLTYRLLATGSDDTSIMVYEWQPSSEPSSLSKSGRFNTIFMLKHHQMGKRER